MLNHANSLQVRCGRNTVYILYNDLDVNDS